MVNRLRFPGKPPANPLLNALMIAGGVLVLVALVVFSILAFLVVASVVAVLTAVVGLRLWWQSRRLSQRAGRGPAHGTSGGRVIEGEYRRMPAHPEDGDEPD